MTSAHRNPVAALVPNGPQPTSGTPFKTASAASAAAGGMYVPDCPGHGTYYLQSSGAVVTQFTNSDAVLWIFPPGAGFIAAPIRGNSVVKPQTLTVRGQQGYGYEATPQVVQVAPDRQEGALDRSYLSWSERGSSMHLSSVSTLSLAEIQQLADSCT